MEDTKSPAAVDLLKQCKQLGKTYFEATQILQQRGYTQAEIEQASYQFPYSDVALPTTSAPPPVEATMNTALGEAESKEEELQAADNKYRSDLWLQYIPIVGFLFRFKAIGDYVNYTSLKTGRSKLVVAGIWISLMLLGTIVVLFIPALIPSMNFLPPTLRALLPRYIVVVLVMLLVLFVFRTKKKQ